MQWKKAPAELTAFLDETMRHFPAQRKTMFGYPVYFVNGNMFAGLHEDNLFIRLSEPDRRSLFAACDEAAHLEPMPGRPMKEYIVVPESLCADRPAFDAWLDRSLRYVQSLPTKESGKKLKR